MQQNKNKNLYCSTGCFIGRANGRNWKLIKDYSQDMEIKKFEFMMLDSFYEQADEIAREVPKYGLEFPVLHADKYIGELYTHCSQEDREQAGKLYEQNCRLADEIGAEYTVLHLWGGFVSDTKFEYNLKCLNDILETAQRHNITVLIENVPCMKENPLARWDEIEAAYPGTKFIFDTRFGGFHNQLDEFASSKRLTDKSVLHMHVSDFTGPPLDFHTLRPILHPGEGIIDFGRFFSSIKGKYTGTVTLESPVLSENGADIEKLNRTLKFISDSLF